MTKAVMYSGGVKGGNVRDVPTVAQEVEEGVRQRDGWEG